ncbi:MAG TPA: TolC family protein [Stellaceae bacterium]|nr:TolC family protein [Stellaceae bacterium]
MQIERLGLAKLARCAALLLPLAGCASYRPHPLDPKATAAALGQRSLSDPRLLRFIDIERRRSDPPRWNLDTLSLVALYERPEMPIAAATVKAAEAGEITAAMLPNPTLSISPTYNTTTVIPSPWQVGPIVDFLVTSLIERPAKIARARAQAEAARRALAVTAWGLRGKVRTALLDLWAARRRLALSTRGLTLARDYETAVAQRYQAGLVSAGTLNLAQLSANQAALRLAADRRTLRLARAGLTASLGLPRQALQGIRLDLAGFDHPQQPPPLAPLFHAALTTRPDVLAGLYRYAATEAALRLAILRQYPSLDMGPGYHYDQGDNKFILDISLPLPILNQNQGPIAAARAARRLAAARFLAVQQRVQGEFERARANWRASAAEAKNAKQVRASAENTVSRRRVAFKAGQIGRLRLVGSQIALVQAEEGALAASVDERVALGALEAALYRPFLVAYGVRR